MWISISVISASGLISFFFSFLFLTLPSLIFSFVINQTVSSGYVYLVFESDKSVRALLHACSQDPFHPEDNREYYFKMSSRRMRCKDVSPALFSRCRKEKFVGKKHVGSCLVFSVNSHFNERAK